MLFIQIHNWPEGQRNTLRQEIFKVVKFCFQNKEDALVEFFSGNETTGNGVRVVLVLVTGFFIKSCGREDERVFCEEMQDAIKKLDKQRKVIIRFELFGDSGVNNSTIFF